MSKAKKASPQATAPEKAVEPTVPKITEAQRDKLELLLAKREIAAMKLQATAEAQALLATNAALAAYEQELSVAYGIPIPLEIHPDNTIVAAPQ